MVRCPTRGRSLETFLVSTGVVALAEMGDKTQLLALFLAARFRRPWPIILGIFVATVANHGVAALLGVALADWLNGDLLKWLLGAGFIVMGLWALKPDTLEEGEVAQVRRRDAFLATLVAFFCVEIGDKTQIATMALAARFQDLFQVTLGTTLGMMLANVPAVLLGGFIADRLPLQTLRISAAAIFVLFGCVVLLEAAGWTFW